MGDQKLSMEKVSGGGRRRKGGLSISVNGGCGVGVGISVFAAAAAAVAVVGVSVMRARQARREDRTMKRSFADDEDNERIEEKEEEVKGEEENASVISQRREEMGEETEEISFQIDQENQSIGKLDLNPRREDTEIAATEEEEIILKADNDGNCDHENSEESKATPTEVKVYEETNDKEEGDEKEGEEDSTENEKAECELSVEFEAMMESSTEETVDESNDDSKACLMESGVFEAVTEAIENTSKTEENDFSAKKREVEWKLEDDVSKVSREEPNKIEISNTTKTIAIEENEIGFAIANRSKGGLLMISAFVLAIVLLLFVRRDHPGVFELSTM